LESREKECEDAGYDPSQRVVMTFANRSGMIR
jgi:hypothetical protein